MTREEARRILGQYDISAVQFYETDGQEIPWDKGFEAIEMAIKALGQPEQRWIPCSETMDIPPRKLLCCDRYGEELIGWLSYVDDQWLCESDGEMMYDPVAWREKPEPYREEGESDE